MKYENTRKIVLDAILDAVDMGLIHGTSGNIAMRDDKEDVVAITPSGISYKGMTADQIAIVDMNGKWLDGPFKPSSEVPMHTAVMRARKDVKATVHTHGMFATIAAMSGELLPITPPQAEFVPVGIVPFTMPGSNDVADKVVEALGRRKSSPDQKSRNVLLWERYESSNGSNNLYRRDGSDNILCKGCRCISADAGRSC